MASKSSITAVWFTFAFQKTLTHTFFCQVIKRRYVGDWVMASYVQVEADAKTTQFYVNAFAKRWKRLEDDDFESALIRQHIPMDGIV